MDINFLRLLFLFMTTSIVIVGNLVNFLENYLPTILVQSFRYGKFSYVGKKNEILIEVPKSWFKHFYVFSSFYSVIALYTAFSRYVFNNDIPSGIFHYLDFFAGANRQTTVDPTAVIIALALLSAQSLRRCYETWFVSVFSKGKMNLSHYMVGYLHYWGAITVVLSEAKHFKNGDLSNAYLTFPTSFQLFGIIVFIYSWYNQYHCAVILANLRKNSKGEVTTEEHKLPQGGLFQVLSSPHLSCEALLYLSLSIILWKSSTFIYVFIWVLSNQMETAFLNHWWYKKTFKNYPTTRKAFIPFVL